MARILLKSLIAAMLLLPEAASYAAAQNLPDLGDQSAAYMSPLDERKLGEGVMREIRRSAVIIDDPEIEHYIQDIGHKLVAHAPRVDVDFTFFVVEDPTINAFAIPGAFIGVNTGLILLTQTESELAGVLAHEISHIVQRHVQQMIVEGKRTSKQVLAGILSGLALAAAGQGQAAQAAMAVTTAGAVQKELHFTFLHEEEADRVGMQILAASGYDPTAMPAFFQRMQQTWGRLNETNQPEFLRTHPVTTARIADATDRAEHYTYHQVPDSVEFYRVRAKLRAMAKGDTNDIAAAFRIDIAQGKYRNLEAERYGYGLALLRAQNYSEARKVASALVVDHPDVLPYLVLQADVELAAGKKTEGLADYAAAAARYPDSGMLARYYAGALLKVGQPAKAKDIIKKTIANDGDSPGLQKMLATAAGDAGDLFEAHRAMASYYYLNGNTQGAIQQLELAKRYAGSNQYLLAAVDARIKEIRQELADERRR